MPGPEQHDYGMIGCFMWSLIIRTCKYPAQLNFSCQEMPPAHWLAHFARVSWPTMRRRGSDCVVRDQWAPGREKRAPKIITAHAGHAFWTCDPCPMCSSVRSTRQTSQDVLVADADRAERLLRRTGVCLTTDSCLCHLYICH